MEAALMIFMKRLLGHVKDLNFRTNREGSVAGLTCMYEKRHQDMIKGY